MGIQCVECQFENPDDSVFCGKCGSRFPLSDENDILITRTLKTPAMDLLKGATFAGRYQIIQELGRGGMGVVYKAHDTKLNRRVALKFLPQELTHIAELKERFIREAQAAAALDHPNICTVYEFDEAEEKTFISMAFIEGQSLKKKIDQGSLDMDEAIKIAIQTAEGLQEAHKKGIIHRDIKSANIMVDERGQAKIMDFGLARMSGGTLLTQKGMAMGTIAYMSPEQARGDKVDSRTDTWSFGVVLYEMFTGQLPFKGDHEQAVVYSILNEKPKPVTEVHEEIPTSLGQVIDKALEKNPDKRYQNIDEMLDDLKSISEGIVPEEIKVRLRKAKLQSRKKAILYAGTAGILIIMTVIALSIFTGPDEAIDAIAVLPFGNLTGNPEQEYFVDAATDELIGQLSQISALRVISRRSVMQYKGVDKPLAEIAQELRVDTVVEGTVHQVGDSVRIRLQLIEALPEERNLWAQIYDRAMSDVLVMYKEMARAIADKTRVKLTPQEEAILTSTRQVNPEAYEAYTKGRFYWQTLNPQDLDIALKYYELALEKDPNFAPAYLGIESVWGVRVLQGFVSYSEALPKRKEALSKALELDDTLPEARTWLEDLRASEKWDWEYAEKSWQRAIELNPDAPLSGYSHFLFQMGRPEEAMAWSERVLEMDPYNVLHRDHHAMNLHYVRRYDEALALLREILRDAPNNLQVLGTLKTTYHLKGMYEEALEIWKKSFALKGDQEAVEALERGYEEEGYSGALSCVAEMMVERSRTTFVTPWQIATLYTRAGRNEEALIWLEKAFEAHDPNMPYIGIDPIFDDLIDNPRFQDLLRKMNLPQAK